MNKLFTTTLTLAALLSGSAKAQDLFSDDASVNSTTTKSKTKIIVRSNQNGDEEGVILNVEGDDQKSIREQLEKQLASQDVNDKSRELFEQALKLHDGTQLKGKLLTVNPFGGDLTLDVFGDQFKESAPQQTLDNIWKGVAKALERAGIDPEVIKEARTFAEAYTNPNKRHMIGVKCSNLGGALRSQLRLEHGLVVEDVFADSPAEKAGLEKHDILLTADNDKLDKVTDLVDAVQAAGVDEHDLTLTLLRSGEEKTLTLKTKLQQSTALQMKDFWGDSERKSEQAIPDLGSTSIQRLFSGRIDKPVDINVEELEETVESLQRTIEELKEKFEDGDEQDE